MSRKAAILAFAVLMILAVTACQPATPTPASPTPTPTLLDAVYYLDVSSGGNTSYAYIKLYGNGRATSVTISLDPPNTGTALEIYNDIAISWLEYPPPNPAYSGTYTLRIPNISLVLISNMETTYLEGTYAPEAITVTGSDGSPLKCLLLPLP